MLKHDEICQRIPHDGRMCLLDEVVSWDEKHIICFSRNHRDPQHPLRGPQGLSVINAIEYGAQAMAVHGSLIQKDMDLSTGPAYLAMVKQVEFGRVSYLDLIPAETLCIRANMQYSDQASMLYSFQLTAAEEMIVSGEAMVIKAGGEQ